MWDQLSPVIEQFTNPTLNQAFFNSMLGETVSKVTTRVNFIKNYIEQQKDLADSLMLNIKRLSPISQLKVKKDLASDAAFESDITSPLPNISGTLQGFTLFFFVLSFFSLAIIFSLNINNISGNTSYAVFTFIAFLFLFIISVAMITRFG